MEAPGVGVAMAVMRVVTSEADMAMARLAAQVVREAVAVVREATEECRSSSQEPCLTDQSAK
jgi:peptidyl-tRNA hydrolase